jgi:2,4-dienoyl-CoA reductase-like NADH-dependent reductase (Old Yellow Enzyme family)/thioredoxin reductase
MNDRGLTHRISRRQVLQAAGLAIAGGALTASCRDDDEEEKVPETEKERRTEFAHLFTPLNIGSFTVRNRILSTAHFTGYAQKGVPSERHLNYWASKSKGGIGLIITEVQPVHPSAGILDNMIRCYEDACIEPFRRVAAAVQEHGAKFIAQLWHPGSSTRSLILGGQQPWAPSPVPNPTYGETPHEMTVEEIQEVVRAYGEAASRMREAGPDGVEIHAAHSYLPDQFMSPLTNRRTDQYGGSEDNRLRFVHEVVDSVRAAVGDDYTVGIRLTGEHFQAGGLVLEDMKRIVPRLTASGKLDYVSISLMGVGTIAPTYIEPGSFVYLAAAIKEVVDVPVFCVGRINDPLMAEEIVATGRADMVGMTRANIVDPELANKARTGRSDEIRRCIACSDGCWGRIEHPEGITCSINASVGREKEMEVIPAPVRKRVMVIGAGLAGMEAARVAALRGHSVTIYDKGQRLGGQLLIAARAPGREEMAEPVRYFERQFELLGVGVRLGSAVTPELVAGEKPDAVIAATGGTPGMLSVPGADGPNVVQARDVLMGLKETGDNVVLVAADQGMEGLTTADFLGERGKRVEILIPESIPGASVESITKIVLLGRLSGEGVVISTRTGVRSIEGDSVVAFNTESGEERRITSVDTVVLAMGSVADDHLLKALSGQEWEVHAVGQCRAPGKMLESALDGLRVGCLV